MKTICIVGLVVLAVFSAHFFSRSLASTPQIPSDVVAEYTRWRTSHGKLYATPAEQNYRLSVFYDQKLFVQRSNEQYEQAAQEVGQELSGPMFELNFLADLTTEEFAARYTGAKTTEEEIDAPVDYPEVENLETATPKLSQSGYQVRIRNQGSCGSCWAFSAITNIEKLHFDRTGQRLDLSQQDLVDCDTRSGGCNGGFPETGMAYVQRAGVAQAANYGYTGARGGCRNVQRVRTAAVGPPNQGWSLNAANYLSSKGVHASCLVKASGQFRYLSRSDDIYQAALSGECNQMVDHAVNQYSSSGDVVTIINSWGTGWGANGLKKIKVCGTNNLWGTQGRIAHAYGSI